ncbi:HAMP domain-containing sensor histidine kinase [Thioclava sp. A2]|uniref:sensor histidine kinase n=1 Tax=Thioclava sp. FCG-A2 TaxID=3080562 RepID=UPI0029551503|nr:HAMP domain-containing sensor histidine kinase [Thioclava sp. A2]MDV7269279.1 HAMP domain-containing sensor histidine kinase [Thioclava sp. A2]
MSRLSLRLRLVLAGAAAVVTALALAAGALAMLFGAHVERLAAAELSVQLDNLIAGIDRPAASDTLVTSSAPTDPRFNLPFGGRYWQINSPDGPALRSRSLWDEVLILPRDHLDDGVEHLHTITGPDGAPLLAVERTVTLPASISPAPLRVSVAMDAGDLAQARAAFMRDIAPYLAALALVLIVAGWMQVSFGLRPLADLGQRISALRDGRSTRLGADIPAELRPLGEEIDTLLAEREAELTRARNRAGDLAHGLKTPLQALIGEAGRLRDADQPEAAHAIEDITATMQRHVERELTRARIASTKGKGRTDLAQIVSQIRRVLERTPQGEALDWQVDIPAGLMAATDPADLTEALGALTENAARHAKTCISFSATRSGGRVALTLADDGPGIPAADIAALIERGARADLRGHGLGLTIAHEIIEAMGGALTLSDAAPGLRIRIDLPAA